MKRREFLQKSALAAATAAAATSGVFVPVESLAQPQAADNWTAGLKSLNAHEGETLLKMMRHLYPHDKVDDSAYAKVALDLDSQAQSSADTAKLLHEGLAKLDEGAKKFLDQGAEEQHASLTAMESSAFFQKVRSTELVGLYNNPEVWKKFDYKGPSYDFGGYLKHGFNDLKWLPDPPEAASPKPA